MKRAAAALFAAVLLGAGADEPSRAPAAVTLTQSGSSLLYPLFRRWASEYHAANPGVRFVLRRSDSESGIADAVAGKVEIGAADTFMSDEQMAAAPEIANVPLAVAAVAVVYNVPGLNAAGLKLDGPALGAIYAGSIRFWDAAAIASLNPGVALPHRAIVPIHRSDASGSTFLFTQYLTYASPAWEDGAGAGTSIAWPRVPGASSAQENPAMIRACRAAPYSIAYVGASIRTAVARARLGTARLRNQDGAFVLPTSQSVGAAAAVLGPRTPPDQRLILVYAPGSGSYPLAGYEYAVVSTKQRDARTARALRAFLLWAVDEYGGNAPGFLDPVRFAPLPPNVRAMSVEQIGTIR